MSRIVAIVGPTATGKSALAMELAMELNGETINADALQVYRGFDIGTAKPALEDRRRIPHHLVDILDGDEVYSAGAFALRAERCLEDLEARSRLALVVGGSGLYQRALFRGLVSIPPIPEDVRRTLRDRCANGGLRSLRAELRKLDPETARRLAPSDAQRIVRALEIVVATGRTQSSWIAGESQAEDRFPVLRIGLTLSRGLLYDRIEARVDHMFERGWVDEVSALLETGLEPSAPAFRAIGYMQLAAHLGGETSLEEARESTIRETRRYAKRQLTWFRRSEPVQWLDAEAVEGDRGGTVAHLRRELEESGDQKTSSDSPRDPFVCWEGHA